MDLDAAFEGVGYRVLQQNEQDLRHSMLIGVDETRAELIEARVACDQLYASFDSDGTHHAYRLVYAFDRVKVLRTLLEGAITYV